VKILAIRGRNLASLAREFEVDLVGGDLGGAGIFAICGPVGAGKTTLLDALCLALFDRTPRLSGRGGVAVAEEGRPEGHWLHSHDPRTLLRRGAGDGQAEVDFTGRDGCRYRATWTVRRARRRADGRIQAQEMSLEDLDRNVTVARASKSEVLGAIRARLGLDFAQFCRSVLLAQGEFAAFLRASADERANLLESLTGADIYRRLSIAAHDRRKQKKAEVDRLASQSQVFELLDAEQRELLDRSASELAEQVRINQMAVDLAQRVVSWYSAASRLRAEEDDATVALQEARDKNIQAEPRRERLLELVRALPLVPRAELTAERQQLVVTAIAAKVESERDLATAHAESDKLRRTQDANLASVLPTDEGEPPPLVVDYPRWQPALVRWSRLGEQLQSLGTSVDAASLRVGDAERAHGTAQTALETARTALQAAEYRQMGDQRRRLVDDRSALRTVADQLRAWQQHAVEAARRRDEIETREAEQKQLASGFEELVAAQHAADEVLQSARRRLEHVRARSDLAAFRSHLVCGAPCPLCGSEEHPDPAVGDDAVQRTAAKAVGAAERQHESARDEVREREARRRECERSLSRERESLQLTEQKADAARLSWLSTAGDAAADTLEAAIAQLAQREAVLLERELEFVKLADRHEADQQRGDHAREEERRSMQALAEARDQLGRCIETTAALREAAAELAPGVAGVAEWERRLGSIGDRAALVLSELAEGESRCRNARSAVEPLSKQSEVHRETVARKEAELQSASESYAAAITREGVTAATVREAAESGAAALLAEQEQLRELANAEDRARAVLQKCAEIRKKHEDRERPAIAESDAAQALEDTREARDVVARELEGVRVKLATDDMLRKQREEIAPRLRDAEASFEVWATVDDLIGHSKGDALAVFAQGLTLDLLLVEANRRLRELAQRYRLEKNRGRDMDFVVVDLDLGSARRGLQSLSGGETFLVSLALALALATLAAPRSRVETLFLDEGFGTLDAQNLEAALGALDSLQASGCQIGIISHVEGIAERIGSVVDVVPEGGGQSRIRVRTG